MIFTPRRLKAALLSAALYFYVVPAAADPISGTIAAIATFAASAATAGSLAASAIFFATEAVLYMALSTALSWITSAIAGKPKVQRAGISGTMQYGSTVPRTFGVGRFATAGSLVYSNTFTVGEHKPNEFLVEVIALSDTAIDGLEKVFNGDTVGTYSESGHTYPGIPGWSIAEFESGPDYYLWVKFYNGTQTAADPTLITLFGSDPDFPWNSNMVGQGVAYAIVTARYNAGVFSGFPQLRFQARGMRLYDPRADSSIGGSGAQRWATPSTWVWSENPAVVLYNLLRGVNAVGWWLYGLQTLDARRLPFANWTAAMNACDFPINDINGTPEPTFRCALEIDTSATLSDAILEIQKSCQARIVEIGGIYKLFVGASPAYVLAFDDSYLLSDQSQSFEQFPSLADTVNAITAKFPDPSQAWATADAPPLYDAALETEDGNRRLPATLAFAAVPFPSQVQRLMASSLLEVRKFRKHALIMPPVFWKLEPGDVVRWNSAKNGYINKDFRCDSIVRDVHLNVLLGISECDPADYDFDPATDYSVYSVPGLVGLPGQTPFAPVDLLVEPSFRALVLDWINIYNVDLEAIEIWRSSTASFGDAVYIGELAPNVSHWVDEGLDSVSQRWYWIRYRARSGLYSPFDPSSAGAGATNSTQTLIGSDASADFIAEAIAAHEGLEFVQLVDALVDADPSVSTLAFLATDHKLYRWDGTTWTAAVPTVDLAGQITAAQITDASITSTKLAAGSVLASNLGFPSGGAALNSDPTPSDIKAWREVDLITALPNYTIAAAPAGGVGASALKATAGTYSAVNIPLIPIDPNKTYRAHMWRYSDAGTDGTSYLQVLWYDASKTYMSSAFTPLNAAPPTAAWQVTDGTFGAGTANPVLSGAAYMGLSVAINYGGTTGATYVQDIRLEEVLPSSLIKDGAVTTIKLNDASVTTAKLGDDSVQTAKIGDNQVVTSKIGDSQITTSKIGDLQVVSTKLADGSVINTKIGNLAVDGTKITDAAIGSTKLAAGSVLASKLGFPSGGAALNSDPTPTDVNAWSGGALWGLTTVSGPAGDIWLYTNNVNAFTENLPPIPLDATKTYRLRGWYQSGPSTDGSVFIGIDLRRADLSVIDGSAPNGGHGGSYWAYFVVGAAASNAQRLVDVQFGAGTPYTFPTGAKFMLPLAYGNYGATTAPYFGIQDFRIEEVIPTSLLGAGSVTTVKLGDASVTTAKLGDASITEVKIGDSQVTTNKIGTGQVTTAKIGDAQVITQKIADDAITSAKIEAIGGTVMDELYVRGCSDWFGADNLVVVGGRVDVDNIANYGLTLTLLSRQDHSQLSYFFDGSSTYVTSRTYATGSATVGLAEVGYLANALTEIRTNAHSSHSAGNFGRDVMVIITSQHFWEGFVTQALVDEMLLCGATLAFKTANSAAYHPYLLIGVPGIGEGRGIEVLTPSAPGTPYAEYDGIMINGNLPGLGGFAEGSVSANLIAARTIVANNIAVGAITAVEIAAHSITAGQIAANTITAAQIAAGTITAAEIAAGTITASKLYIPAGGAALNSDPTPSDISAWPTFNSPNTAAANYSIVSIGGGKVGPLTLRSLGGTAQVANRPLIPIDPNKTYRIHMWYYSDAGTNGTTYMQVHYFDAAGSYVSAYSPLNGAPPLASWQEANAVFGFGTPNPFPSVSYMAPAPALNYGGTTGATYAQDIRIEEVIPGTLIQDGTISTNKIAAGAVVAASIAGHTITAAQIAAGTITASEIAAGSILASKLFVAPVGAALNSDPQPADPDAWVGGTVQIVVGGGSTLGNMEGSITTATTRVSNNPPVAIDKLGGKTYRFHANYISGAGMNGAQYLGVEFIRTDGVTLSTINSVYWFVNAEAPVNSWSEVTVQFGVNTPYPIPADAVLMRPTIAANWGTTTGSPVLVFTDIRIEEAIPGTLIKDGVITTDKIAANAITAGKIAADAITAGTISAGAVDAGDIIVDNLIVTGHLVDGSATTPKLAAEAATGFRYAQGSSLTPSITQDNTFRDLVAINYTTTGNPVIISFSTLIRNDDASTRGLYIRLVRAGFGRLWPPASDTDGAFSLIPSDGKTIAFSFTEQPSAGNYTWQVQYMGAGASNPENIKILVPYMQIEEIKR